MRRISYLLFPLLIEAISCNTSANLDVEKDAIRAVIEKEKDGYLNRDVDRIRETWIQDSGSRKIFLSERGMTYLNGWEMVDNDHIRASESEMWDNVQDLGVEFSDYEFNIQGSTALVIFNSTWSGICYGRELDYVQERILHLVKVDGQWKLDLMTIFTIPDENEN